MSFQFSSFIAVAYDWSMQRGIEYQRKRFFPHKVVDIFRIALQRYILSPLVFFSIIVLFPNFPAIIRGSPLVTFSSSFVREEI